MKKNIKRLLLGIAVSATAAFAVVASGCSATDKIEGWFNQLTCEHKTTETVAAVAPTCTEDGHAEYEECVDCGKDVVKKVVIEATGHTLETVKGYEATCTAMGLTDGAVCTVCEETVTKQEKIPALGHKKVEVKEVKATCTTAGNTAGVICENGCGTVYEGYETIEIDPTAHKLVDGVCEYCEKVITMKLSEVKAGDDLTGYTLRLAVSEEEFKDKLFLTQDEGYHFTAAMGSPEKSMEGGSYYGIESADTPVFKFNVQGVQALTADGEYVTVIDWSAAQSETDDFTVEVTNYVLPSGYTYVSDANLTTAFDVFELYYVGDTLATAEAYTEAPVEALGATDTAFWTARY